MSRPDLVLLHPPSVIDFRKKTLLLGPISDLIPSTPVFEMYPVGFATIASHLESKNFEVRIANIATRMLGSERFDPEKFVKSLDANMFGIDLHWMPHVHGTRELSRMVRKHHPDVPIVLGGFSSSYYHEDIIRSWPEIDFVLRGDSTERPLELLMSALASGRSLDGVPNLTWRDKSKVRVNPLTHVPETLDDINLDYGLLVRKVLRYRDLQGHLPYRNWKSNPMSIAVSVRGCVHNCANCAGSCDSFARNFGRKRPAFRSPELLAEDVDQAEEYLKGATFIVGDIRQAGKDYASRFLAELKRRKISNQLVLELFGPADADFAKEIATSVDNFNIQISPETHDETVRAAQGKHYTNSALEKTAASMLDAGCGRLDMFYMIGLPQQTSESVEGTVRYAEKLYERFRGKRLYPFISPLAPFLDPGGNAFEDPEKYGYRLFAKGLEDHARLAMMPSWKHVLNYETRWMTRGQIGESTYSAGLGLNEIKKRMGLVSEEVANRTEARILAARDLMGRIDSMLEKGGVTDANMEALREDARSLSESTVCEKEELDWSEFSVYASIPRMISAIVRGK